MSQSALAKQCGLSSKQIIFGYEKGNTEPDFTSLIEIAKQLNVSCDYLLGRTDYKNQREEFLYKTFEEQRKEFIWEKIKDTNPSYRDILNKYTIEQIKDFSHEVYELINHIFDKIYSIDTTSSKIIENSSLGFLDIFNNVLQRVLLLQEASSIKSYETNESETTMDNMHLLNNQLEEMSKIKSEILLFLDKACIEVYETHIRKIAITKLKEEDIDKLDKIRAE